MMSDDMRLLREYAGSRSESAFEQVVTRHLSLVYSTALRRVGDAHLAEEVAQAVFIALAQKAGNMGANTIVAAWLYRATRFAAANALKQRRRQQQREQEAYMQSLLEEPPSDEVWQQIGPLLDSAIDSLNESERAAVLLRYFENKSLAEVGEALGLSADAARMRVNRALEKLRGKFVKQGVTLGAPLIAGAIATHSVQAAPLALGPAVTTLAVAKGVTAGGSILTLAKGTLKLMAWTKLKITAVVGVSLLFVAGTTTVVVVSKSAPPLLPLQPLPNPNGYDTLVAAGKLVSPDSGNYPTASLAQLRATVQANAGALALARTGLSNECRVPVQFNQAFDTSQMGDLSRLKTLAQAFATEGRWATMENRPGDAARSYLDAIRLGVKSPQGGLLIDQLVGTAGEAIGTASLQQLVSQLDAATCRKTARAMETLDRQRQSWDDVVRQEQNWSGRTFPGFRYELARFMTRKSLEATYRKGNDKFQKQLLNERQVMIALAVRAYTLDKGHPPGDLADLTPDYLEAVPQNPVTGGPMNYSPK